MLKYIIIITVSLIAGFAVGNWLLIAPVNDTHEHEQVEATYRCPIPPGVVSDRPGSCVVCDMDLVKDQAGTTRSSMTGEREKTNDQKQFLILGF